MGLIYEHWRLDTNECFYIGKADGKNPYKRANNLSPRNPHHGHIVRNLKPLGLIEVRTGEFPGIKKAALNNLERLCIAHWRMYIGDRLTNQTDGGDGQSSEWAKEFFARPDIQEKKIQGIRKFDRSERGKKIRKESSITAAQTRRGRGNDFFAGPNNPQLTASKQQKTERARKTVIKRKENGTEHNPSKTMSSEQLSLRAKKSSQTALVRGTHPSLSLTSSDLSKRALKSWETRRQIDAEKKEKGLSTSSEQAAETRRRKDAEKKATGLLTSREKAIETRRRNKELKLAALEATKDTEK
jgi:hypothetical protein